MLRTEALLLGVSVLQEVAEPGLLALGVLVDEKASTLGGTPVTNCV